VLINQHVGEASCFWVFEPQPGGPPALVETRDAPEAGGGATRWYELAELLHDCKAVFTSAVGQTPRRILEQHGIRVIEAVGVASDAIAAWRRHRPGPARNAEVVPGLRQGLRGPGNGLRIERYRRIHGKTKTSRLRLWKLPRGG
jgi:nitrogen fixation protein NifB